MWRLFKIYVKNRNQLYLKPAVIQSIANLCSGSLESYTKKAKMRYVDHRKIFRVQEIFKLHIKGTCFKTIKTYYEKISNFKKTKLEAFVSRIMNEWLI